MESRLDVTLTSAEFVSPWLAGWLREAAENPENVKAVVVEKSGGQLIIELRDQTGVAAGGILFFRGLDSIHVLPAVAHDNEPFTKRRSLDELNSALTLAIQRRDFEKKLFAVVQGAAYFVVMAAFFGFLFLFAQWLS